MTDHKTSYVNPGDISKLTDRELLERMFNIIMVSSSFQQCIAVWLSDAGLGDYAKVMYLTSRLIHASTGDADKGEEFMDSVTQGLWTKFGDAVEGITDPKTREAIIEAIASGETGTDNDN